ncbi:Molecular chaperone GrpE (heat shock protein) [Ruminococcaceae bacterium YRB3002]|nr:Molecular chaperone GrpE (heat shock protein) [Ruminococcaceae bacterium YRB3002]
MDDERIPDNVTVPVEEPVSDEILLESDQAEENADCASEPQPVVGEEVQPLENEVQQGTDTQDVPAHEDVDYIKRIDEHLDVISGTEQRLLSEIKEMHKLYHSEFAGRLQSMQEELEHYRSVEKGRIYDDILAAIAKIYGNNETLADEVEDPKAKKNIRYLLLDLEELLSSYGMTKIRSNPGDKRNPRHCQILNRIPTEDADKHDTVVKSYNSGFYIGNRTVIKELVDVFVLERKETENKTEEIIKDAGDEPVVE